MGICYAFNNSSCSFNPYKFRHMCTNCSSPHTQVYCNSRQKYYVSTLFDLVFTFIVYSHLQAELESYPFEGDKQQLLHGLKFGILLHYAGPRVPKDVKDLVG